MASSGSSPSRTPARTDKTATFKSLASDSEGSSSQNTRRELHRPPPKSKAAEQWHARRRAEKHWNHEAQKISSVVQSLHQFLSTIRRPYLHHGPAPKRLNDLRQPREFGKDADDGTDHHGQFTLVGSNGPDGDFLYLFSSHDHLTENQKDEVDSHLKLVLDRSVERLRALIKAEQVRQAAHPAPSSTSLARLLAPSLPAIALDSLEYSAQLAQHRNAITSALGASLKRASEKVGLMQEARIAALKEKRGNRRTPVVSRQINFKTAGVASSGEKILAGSRASFSAYADGASRLSELEPGLKALQREELTQEQEQLFASESSALAKTLESDLATVDAVSRTLSTISELQTTLISHLSQQNETIAALGGEALDQRIEVQRGNQQLKKAKERNRSANRLLCALLVGSGLALLFLHAMD